MTRSVDEIFESMGKILREGVEDGSIHFNPPPKNYLKKLLEKAQDDPRFQELLASAPPEVRERWMK